MANDIRNIVRDGVRPDRAADNLKVCNSARGGATTWQKKRVVRIDAPLRSGAQARTIRIHELLHANHSPITRSRKFPELAQQAIEDARVHAIYWPRSMPRQADRDCLASALRDLRTIPPMMAALGRAEDWNLNLLVALRCLAIIKRLGNDKHLGRIRDRITAALGLVVDEKLVNEILPKVKSRKTQALREFTALMRDDDEPQLGGNCKGKGSTGKATANPMRIIRLPMPEACNSAIRRTALARSGARLNRARLVRAVVTGSTAELFIRPRYLPGGTYLIDASGSMGLSAYRLHELCRAVPAAKVAYYSGWSSQSDDGAYGELVIYAENGRRADRCRNMYGGNEVDLFALQWLLRQPAPRVFVCDGGFCGGPEGQDSQAAALLASAVANGKIEWLQSVHDLETKLGIL